MRWLAIVLVLFIPVSALAATPQLLGVLRSDSTHVWFGQFIVPLGDQNSDGCADILVYNGYHQNYLYLGGKVFDSTLDLRFVNTGSFARLIGDANSDGYQDFAVMGGSGSNWRLNLYYGGPLLDTIPDHSFGVDSLWPLGPAWLGGDLNRNGSDELISPAQDSRAVLLYELNQPDSLPAMIIRPANKQYLDFNNFGRGLAVGDFNGDGIKDMAVGLNLRGTSLKSGEVDLYFGGQALDTLPDLILPRPGPYIEGAEDFGAVIENVGDVNGDGFDDLFVGSFADLDSLNYVWFGGPGIGAQPNLTIPTWLSYVHPAGDINRDGYPDIIGSTPSPYSGSGAVYIFYGGPHMTGQWDIRIANWDFPGYHDYFGMNCAGIGDFNGDGVDDFAFSLLDAFSRGWVYIYSGTGDPVDVPYYYQPTVPESFSLHQNFPNPFNPTTSISFDLPKRSATKLTIFNIRGERVATLLDWELAAGTYRLEWDGRNAVGRTVASGVYLYRLETAEAVQARKMLLLK